MISACLKIRDLPYFSQQQLVSLRSLNIKQHIPNAITSGNLLCGCLAITEIFNNNLTGAAYLIGIAAILDFFDGFAARMLKVSSPIGKDLDSLADMVTFGVVPGFILFKLMAMAQTYSYSEEAIGEVVKTGSINWVNYTAFLIPVFSALRLAKFNHDIRQSDSFIGLPTPANTLLIASFPLTLQFGSPALAPYILNTTTLCSISVILSALLVAELPLIALKFKSFGWKGNEIRYIFMIGCAVLLFLFQVTGIALAIIFYLIISLINNLISKS